MQGSQTFDHFCSLRSKADGLRAVSGAAQTAVESFLTTVVAIGAAHTCGTLEPYKLLPPLPSDPRNSLEPQRCQILLSYDPSLSLTKRGIQIINSSEDVVRAPGGHRKC